MSKVEEEAPPPSASLASARSVSEVARDDASSIYNKRIDDLVGGATIEPFFEEAKEKGWADNLMACGSAVGLDSQNAGKMAIQAVPFAGKAFAAGAVATASYYAYKKTNAFLQTLVGCKDITSDEALHGMYCLASLWRFQKGSLAIRRNGEHEAELSKCHNDQILSLERLARLCELSYEDNCFMERVALKSQRLSIVYSMDAERLDKKKAKSLYASVWGTGTPNELLSFRPKFAIFARATGEKVAYLVIRGTKDKEDIMTDLSAGTVDLAILDESGTLHDHVGHEGIARAAAVVNKWVRPILLRLLGEGFRISMTGHSLGGAVASLLAALWREETETEGGISLASIDCVCFGPPPCMDQGLSDKLTKDGVFMENIFNDETPAASKGKGSFLTIVNRDDVVPRLSRQNARHVFKIISAGKPAWATNRTSLGAYRKDLAIDAWVEQASPAEKLDEFRKKENLWMEIIRTAEAETREAVVAAEGAAAAAETEASSVDLVVPGRMLHLYKVQGKSCGAELVPRSKESMTMWPPHLAQIQPTPAMLDDHGIKCYAEELHTIRNSWDSAAAPNYHPFGGAAESPISKCEICDRDFSHATKVKSTFNFTTDMHHCRSCGFVVCDTCSEHKRALPQLGIHTAQRTCDICVFGSIARM